ncbi:MAG: DUF4450 domain-containing protein [Tepidisphaeraceae bacterium]
MPVHHQQLIASAVLLALASFSFAAEPVLKGQTERPLRYKPVDNGFEITNGPDSFNRPLYGGHTAFRADAGDKPEFSLYLPGRGGVTRVGLSINGQTKWLRDAATIGARYADAAMSYVVTDPAWPGVTVRLKAVGLREREGLALRIEADGLTEPAELLIAYGGAAGDKSSRNGDIGTEKSVVSKYFALTPEHCRGNRFTVEKNVFVLDGKAARTIGIAPADAKLGTADAREWASPELLKKSVGEKSETPLMFMTAALSPKTPAYFVLLNAGAASTSQPGGDSATLATSSAAFSAEKAFADADAEAKAVARKVVVDTPDAFINSAVNAMNVAADALWDAPSQSFMHGGVAWRRPYLGWRGPYAGDAMGLHDRTEKHLDLYFKKQNTKLLTEQKLTADENEGLARSEAMIHSNGDLTNSHYDMNLVAVDTFFRHLLWTGDLEYAKKNWPVIERHLAWEKRLFRRPFGKDGLPLYEAYACIWASDDLQYSGGGVTHASAYNYFHNTMAARVAELIGRDPTPYREEAALIKKAMNEFLWLADKGWFAESKDLLGNQLVHPAAALWTHYHTIDSQVPDAFQAWQMCRYVDTQIPHIPIHGPGVPEGLFTLSSTNWMPYMWSINNVAMAEVTHTALADWQAGRPDAAFSIFKGALVDSMFLGQCPGNIHMTSFFDPYRQEAQRDSGDPVGITWRALVEGLFGITPDALKGELTIKPGWSSEWDHASIQHPNVSIQFKRNPGEDEFAIQPKFATRMSLRLRLPIRGFPVGKVTVNGAPAKLAEAIVVGSPAIEIVAEPAEKWDVRVQWGEQKPGKSKVEAHANVVGERAVLIPSGPVMDWKEAQGLFAADMTGRSLAGEFKRAGKGTVFVRIPTERGEHWEPIDIDVAGATEILATTNVTTAKSYAEIVDLTASFNDRVTQIFKNKYLSPRSPYASLAMPVQGVGGWASNKGNPKIDDTGLRASAGW